MYIDPHTPNGHPKGLINSVTGKQIGKQQTRDYEERWSASFIKTLCMTTLHNVSIAKAAKSRSGPVLYTYQIDIITCARSTEGQRLIWRLLLWMKWHLYPHIHVWWWHAGNYVQINHEENAIGCVSDRQCDPSICMIPDGCSAMNHQLANALDGRGLHQKYT